MRVDPDKPLRDYWLARLVTHVADTYKGLALVKFPEDLRTYQIIIEDTRPEIIVELGTHQGGSAVWFADQLSTFTGNGHVVTVDVLPVTIPDPRITVVRGDLRQVVQHVGAIVEGRRTMVVDDSAHTYDVTLAALRSYARYVTKGCFFVVEDTIVDTDLSIWPDIKGAGKAVKDFLLEEDRFIPRDLDLYGVTMHMGGWLEAIR